MAKQENTGVQIAITTSLPATYDETGYAAVADFTDIGEVLSVGAFGSQSDEITSQPLATGVTEFFKGFIQYGSFDLGLDRDSTDAGQAILAAASDGATKADAHSIKVTLPDGEVIYMDARVFSYTVDIGSANSMVGSTAAIRINKKPVFVAAP